MFTTLQPNPVITFTAETTKMYRSVAEKKNVAVKWVSTVQLCFLRGVTGRAVIGGNLLLVGRGN